MQKPDPRDETIERLRGLLVEAKEAMAERRGYCEMWEYKYGDGWDEEDARIDAELAKGKEATDGN